MVAEVSWLDQLRFGGLTTSPIRIALAETLIRQTLPSTTARTFWMFGLNLRRVTPVTFRPTPPRYLALPRRAMLLPLRVFRPVKKQIRDIGLPHHDSALSAGRENS